MAPASPNPHFGSLGVAVKWFRVRKGLTTNYFVPYFAPAGSLRWKSVIKDSAGQTGADNELREQFS